MSEVRLITCVGVTHDLPLLAHFIAHYRALGISPANMHVILNASDADDDRLATAEDMLHGAGTPPPRHWLAPYTSDSMWAERRRMQEDIAASDDWVISADIDEFHEYPRPLMQFLDWCAARRIDCVQGPFIDRLATDGGLNSVTAAPSLWEQYPVRADVACTIRRDEGQRFWYGTVKLMAMRGYLLPKRGGHQPYAQTHTPNFLFGAPLAAFPGMTRAAVRFALPLRVHHFKWTAALRNAVIRRLETPGASEAGSRYGRRLLDFMGDEDRIPLDRVPRMSIDPLGPVPWTWRVALLRRFAHRARW